MSQPYEARGDITLRDCPESREALQRLRDACGELDVQVTEADGRPYSPAAGTFCVSVYGEADLSMAGGMRLDDRLYALGAWAVEAAEFEFGPTHDAGLGWLGVDEAQIAAGKKAQWFCRFREATRNLIPRLDAGERASLVAELEGLAEAITEEGERDGT